MTYVGTCGPVKVTQETDHHGAPQPSADPRRARRQEELELTPLAAFSPSALAVPGPGAHRAGLAPTLASGSALPAAQASVAC